MTTGLKLTDHEARTYTLAEIAAQIVADPDTLRTWFNGGGLALFPPLDTPSAGGRGRSHRLHWRTAAMLLIAVKLNEFGFGLGSGEAAELAGAAFKAGLTLEDFCSEWGPLIVVERRAGQAFGVHLVTRYGPVEDVARTAIRDGFEGVGRLVIDPIGIGRIIWRCAMVQLAAEVPEPGPLPSVAEACEAAGITAEDLDGLLYGDGHADPLGIMAQTSPDPAPFVTGGPVGPGFGLTAARPLIPAEVYAKGGKVEPGHYLLPEGMTLCGSREVILPSGGTIRPRGLDRSTAVSITVDVQWDFEPAGHPHVVVPRASDADPA